LNEDDVPLGALKIPPNEKDEIDDRPLPILNTTLNVVRGKELALQTRKARSFPFTPLCVGFTRPYKVRRSPNQSLHLRMRSVPTDPIQNMA